MTARQLLALVVTDPNESLGDEGMPAEEMQDTDPNADTDLMFRMKLDLRLRRIEKQLDRIGATPEIVAALARLDTRSAY